MHQGSGLGLLGSIAADTWCGLFAVLLQVLMYELGSMHSFIADGLDSRSIVYFAQWWLLVLQELVGNVWNISQFFFWAFRGVEFLCSRNCLGKSNFKDGGL